MSIGHQRKIWSTKNLDLIFSSALQDSDSLAKYGPTKLRVVRVVDGLTISKVPSKFFWLKSTAKWKDW